MFDGLKQQNIADMLKALVHAGDQDDSYSRAMEALQRFEGSGWQPRLFADLAARRAPGLKRGSDGKLHYTPVRGDNARQAVTKLLEAYLVAIAPHPIPGMLSTTEAATYLGLKIAMMRRYSAGRIQPTVIGGNFYFSIVELDKFDNEKRRSSGRPRMAEKADS